jgi:excisionase family DNA binding protein
MANSLAEREPVALEEGQREDAAAAAATVEAAVEERGREPMLTLTLEDESRVTVPVKALALLADLLREMSRGNAVTIVPYGKEVTTQQAADLLNVSRPYVVKLIENDVLPARKVGPRRRIRFEDLIAFKQKDDAKQRNVARELTREAEELGLGYK